MAALTATFRTIQASALRTGIVLQSPICDQNGRKLLGAGIEITSALLERLSERQIFAVLITEEDAIRLQEAAEKEQAESTPAAEQAYVAGLEEDVQHAYSPGAIRTLVNRHRQAVGKLHDYLASLAAQESVRLEVAESLAHGLYKDMFGDSDLCVCLGSMPSADRYPSRHSLQTALMSMALARSLHLKSSELLELGIGCLLHDVGMLRIPASRYQVPRALTREEFSDVARHPLLTYELLQEHVDSVPANARIVAYEMHERSNGSGYPRGLSGQQIHPLARLASVADTYVAMVSPRPHREALNPYTAVEKLLRSVKLGLYDPESVRALLHTTSLFPIGSRVVLSDGRKGRVVRANGPQYDRPIVEIVDNEVGGLLDLTQTRSVKVSASLPLLV